MSELDLVYIENNKSKEISIFIIIRFVVHWRRANALRYNKKRNVAMSSYNIGLI